MNIYVSGKTREILEKRGTCKSIMNDAREFDFYPIVLERILRRIDPTLLNKYLMRLVPPPKKKYDVWFVLSEKKEPTS